MMPHFDRLTNRVLLRLIRESEEEREERGRRRLARGAGMAAFVITYAGHAVGIIYDPTALIQNVPAASGPARGAGDVIVSEIILGVIMVSKPDDPCNGAWEVGMSAVKNKGDGGLIYGLAYAMTPKGELTADRRSVSQAAQTGWSTTKVRQGGVPFDDVINPKTADPSDDCRLHRGGDACKGGHKDLDSLNRSYSPEGWERPLLRQMQQVHDETMTQLDPNQVKNVTRNFEMKASAFFNRYYG